MLSKEACPVLDFSEYLCTRTMSEVLGKPLNAAAHVTLRRSKIWGGLPSQLGLTACGDRMGRKRCTADDTGCDAAPAGV